MTINAMNVEVLIVGAGPTGLTLAVDLARRGISFRILDSAAGPFFGSRGKGIQPRTLEVFDDLGMVDSILAQGALYPKLRFHLGPFSLRAGSLGLRRPATEQVPYPNLWMVPQSKTESILRERLREFGADVEFGKALVAFTQNDQNQSEKEVTASLSTGETIKAKFLVGCDGGHSIVRKTLGLSLQGETIADKLAFVADLEVENLDRNDWHIWPFAKGGAVGLCPLPNTSLFQFIAEQTSSDADLAARIHKATGHRVKRVAWSSTYRPSARMVERYRVGRVLLAGDAAHVHPPAGGQGLNTGVQDAYNLGWKLACVIRGGPDSLLNSYEEERLPIAAAVLGLTKRLHQTRSIKRGDATNQLHLHYRSSSLSSGVALGNLHPGDRMPDARLEDGTRLFDHLRGPHATEIVAQRGHNILVRPDGYIANIGPERFDQYAGERTHQVTTRVFENRASNA
jgi:2-polyprenyl-6-methoxyphenol hydroxylase-like FAD-dependent oxidoreductase